LQGKLAGHKRANLLLAQQNQGRKAKINLLGCKFEAIKIKRILQPFKSETRIARFGRPGGLLEFLFYS
jgi:hypothetical protein